MECEEYNFLMQLVSEPTRGGASLELLLTNREDLLFTNREELVENVVVGGCLGLSDREMIEFSILVEVRRGASKTSTMDFQRADFGLFRTLVHSFPWMRVLKGKGVQAGWIFFKEEVLKTQEQAVPICHKINWQGKLLACLNKKLLLERRKKIRVYCFWKKGKADQEEYRGLVRSCREEIRKAKAQLEFSLATVLREKKFFTNTLTTKREPRRISILYWM